MTKENSSRSWNDFLDKAVNILLEDPIKVSSDYLNTEITP